MVIADVNKFWTPKGPGSCRRIYIHLYSP